MDSCNSGSMSSSGGDDEYDSRAESSVSAFLNHNDNNNPLTHVGPMSNPPPPPPPPEHHRHQPHHHSMFDPLSNYFHPLSSSSSSSRSPLTTNPTSLLNLDMVWSKNLRSDPNCTDLGGGFVAVSSSPTQQFFTNQTQTRPTFNPSIQNPQAQETVSTRGPGLASGSGSNDNQTANNSTTAVRNTKKRSRASRRAPTTVLTTDTTNFRAMVQEFTGIPAPPFTSSPFPRSRLDLFGTSATAFRLAATGSHLESPQPPYLLRPFAQKIQPPFLSSPTSTSSSMIDAIASTTTTTNVNNATNTTSTSATSSSDLSLLKYPQNLLDINMQNNPILSFHSLLQPSPKFSLQNSSIFGSGDTTKPPPPPPQQQGSLDIPSNDSHLKMGLLEELGLSHGHVTSNLTGLQNLASSSDTTLRRSDHSNWGDGGAWSNEGDLLRSINDNYNTDNSTQRVASNAKANYSTSSSDFHHGDKGPPEPNVVANTRTEGMVESWICSSD